MKQEGKPGEKTTTTPITINPITGEKVGEGDPTEEITKEPVDEIIEFGPGDVDPDVDPGVNPGVDSDINEATNSKVASNNESNTKLESYENVSDISNTEMVSKNSLNSNKKEDSKTLPNTGETNNQNSTILGSLFVAIGSLLLFRKRTKNSEGK